MKTAQPSLSGRKLPRETTMQVKHGCSFPTCLCWWLSVITSGHGHRFTADDPAGIIYYYKYKELSRVFLPSFDSGGLGFVKPQLPLLLLRGLFSPLYVLFEH